VIGSLAQQAADPLQPVAPFIFYALALLTVMSAWAIVISQNIVRMALYLLLTLTGVAGFYFFLQAELLAALQLIVYAGGTLILIVFGIMLTQRGQFSQLRIPVWERVLGVFVALGVAGMILWAVVTTTLPATRIPATPGYDQVAAVGRSLLTNHLVAFEAAAVILLVVMIGAAYIARRRSAE